MPAIGRRSTGRIILGGPGGGCAREFLSRNFAPLVIFFLSLGILASAQTTDAGSRGTVSVSSENGPEKSFETKQDIFKISIDVKLVTTDVTVIGNGANDLLADDFLLYDNALPQHVTYFSHTEQPLAIAVLLDRSRSVSPYFPILKIAALLSVKNLKPEDQVALFAFTDNCERLSDLSGDRLLLSKKIQNLKTAEGRTNIYHALYVAARYLREKAPDRRRAIILVSDNCQTGSQGSEENARDALLKSAATLYSIHTPGDKSTYSALALSSCLDSDTFARSMADRSGGESLVVDSSTSLQTALSKAMLKIRNQYTLGYDPSNPGEYGSFHSLEVRLKTPHGCSDCRLLTRKGYYSGMSPPKPPTRGFQPVSSDTKKSTDQLLILKSIMIAGTNELEIPDIPFTVETAELREPSRLQVDIKIRPGGIGFKGMEDGQSCNLQITFFYVDGKGKIPGWDWKRVEREFSEEEFGRIGREGVSFRETVSLGPETRALKVVVYDEESNKIGSILTVLSR